MATYPAIAATSDAVLGLLQSAAVGTEFDGVAFAHYQSGDFESPMSDGVTLYLYRVTVSSNRNLPPQVGPDGRRYRPPIPLDLHFLVTAWAETAVRQQRMLGFAIRTLEDTPILPAGVLNQHSPEPNVFRPEETVELVYENLTVQDIGYIWDVAQTKEQPSATYTARMVEIESPVAFDEGGLVQTRELQFAQADSQ
jgi:Pvc16 N-terminal domain